MKTLSDPIILSFFLIRGSCRRATRTCSRSAQKQASRAVLRPGPARRHPLGLFRAREMAVGPRPESPVRPGSR